MKDQKAHIGIDSTKPASSKPECMSPNVTNPAQYERYFDWYCTGFSFTKYKDDQLTKTQTNNNFTYTLQ